MKAYNIYYNNNKLNKRPISEIDVENILKRNFVFKIINNNNIKIPTNKLNFVECIVI